MFFFGSLFLSILGMMVLFSKNKVCFMVDSCIPSISSETTTSCKTNILVGGISYLLVGITGLLACFVL